MPWTPLRDRLNQLPLILAGPILRRTESEAVTVWLALREACEVTLEIYATQEGDGRVVGPLLLQGKGSTIALGQHLHLVAVTAEATTFLLASGQVYAYDLKFRQLSTNLLSAQAELFSPSPEPAWTLQQALNCNALPRVSISYFDHQLPSFSLPPDDLKHVRLVHGSCRKVHGGDRDALPILDDLIEQNCTQANARPHQLFLTGDQIYGDEVADPLLMALTEAGDTLLGWEERLPLDESIEKSAACLPQSLQPGQRSQVAEEIGGFTASLYDQPDCAKSHLFSLGEYCAIYLFTWSQTLWSEFPSAQEMGRKSKSAKVWEQERRVIREFAQTLWRVRRALANIPTYMIFDDHDISDDWYLNREWCLRVLGRPMGRRSVQNGLLAYALFQGWGNTPPQFASGTGKALLEAAAAWSASGATDAAAERTIAQSLGLPDCDAQGLPQFRLDGAVLILDRQPQALDWHYVVRSHRYEVIVLDTRTWRGYPADQPTNAPPMLLSPTAFDRQLRESMQETAQQSGSQVTATLVVAPTNLVSLKAIDIIQNWNLKQGKTFHNDVGDAWNINKPAFARLLNTLFEQRDRIIILSGDIHYGSTVCLHYWSRQSAEPPLGQAFEKPHVLIQLTASAIKNSELKTRIVHTKVKSLVDEDPEDWAGWTDRPPELLQVRSFLGFRQVKPLSLPAQTPLVQRLYRTGNRSFSHWDIAVRQPQFLPDWRYHFDWIKRQPAQIAFDRSRLPKPKSGNLLQRLKQGLAQLLWNNRWLQEGEQVVGLNNIGLVQFSDADQDAGQDADQDTGQLETRSVLHDLYWYAPWRSGLTVFSRYQASLDLKDPPPPMQVLRAEGKHIE